jgi:hypothetical protein
MCYQYISLKLLLYPVVPEMDGHYHDKLEIGTQFVNWFSMFMT